MMIQINITKEDVQFCRRKVAEYLARAEELEAKAQSCKPAQRGGYRSHAVQCRKNAQRMRANEASQMGWLAENNFELWENLNESQNNEPTIIAGQHHAEGTGDITAIDVRGPAVLAPGTKSNATGTGKVTASRIG